MNKLIEIFTCLSLFGLLLGIYIYSTDQVYSSDILKFILGIDFVVFCIFILSKERNTKLKKQYLKPSYLFLIGFLIVFFQAYIDLVLGNISEYEYFRFISPGLINQSAALSSMGFVLFVCGYFVKSRNVTTNIRSANQVLVSTKSLKYVFYIASLFFFLLSVKDLLSGGYSQEMIENKAGSLGSYAELLFMISYFSLLTLSIKNLNLKNKKSLKHLVNELGIPFHIIILIYFALILISGDRGPLIVIILSYFFSYLLLVKRRFSIKMVLSGLVLGAFFITVLGFVRKMDNDVTLYNRMIEVTSKMKSGDSFEDQSVLNSTVELSKSVRTVHLSVKYIDEGNSYLYGSIQVRELIYAIPFLSNLMQVFQDPHFRYKNSAFFITWLDKGEFYTVGTGSSIIADLFLSFGEVGVFVGMFFLGIFFRKIDVTTFVLDLSNARYLDLLIVIIICSLSIYWSRATFLTVIRYIILSYVLVSTYSHVKARSVKR